MHRTQLLIEDWQYETLKARAASRRVSISELVREILTRHLRESAVSAPDRLGRIEGIAEDHAVYGRDHDAVLYGPDED